MLAAIKKPQYNQCKNQRKLTAKNTHEELEIVEKSNQDETWKNLTSSYGQARRKVCKCISNKINLKSGTGPPLTFLLFPASNNMEKAGAFNEHFCSAFRKKPGEVLLPYDDNKNTHFQSNCKEANVKYQQFKS